MRISILMVMLLLTASATVAQFNDTTNYFVNLSSTGIINKTNDRNSWLLNNHLRFSLYKKGLSLNSAVTFVYGEQQRVLSNRDFASTIDFNRYINERSLYLWGLASYEKNFSLKIEDRLQSGLGIGLSLIDKSNAFISLSDGILYESSELMPNSEGVVVDYETFRNSFRLKFRFLISDKITIDGVDFLQHALSDRKDYIIRSQTNFSYKLMKWLNFTAGVTYNKMSVTSRENLLVNFGLTLERYF